MKEYSMELCGVKRTLPFIPISEEMAFASFVVLGDTELVSACAPELVAKIGEVDAIVTAEAKGIALAYEVSKELGHKEFIVARKSTKSYMKDVVSASVHSITTAGEQHLYLDGKDADKIRGKRVCLLDDVISETVEQILHALECLMANASAEVVKKQRSLLRAMLLIEKILYFCRSFRYSKRRATESTKSSNNCQSF
mgnify:CR=1 FL=1